MPLNNASDHGSDETPMKRIREGHLGVKDTSIVRANEKARISCTRWETSPGLFAMNTNEIAV